MFAGSRGIQVTDQTKGISFPVLLQYPTEVPSAPTAFGPYTMDVAPNAPVAAGSFPLVVVSHGGGGSHLLYRTITTHLARNGYVVAMLEHPGNNRNNNELEGTRENLVNRPRHVRLTIDAVASDGVLDRSVRPDHVAIIGHSMGGYTALAVAGGTPWAPTKRTDRAITVEAVDVVTDPRVRTLVLLAPATAFFVLEGSLRRVTVPILLLSAEHDTVTARWQAELLLDRVPDRTQVTHRIVENAGHLSFLSPFPSPMKSPAFPPSVDPPGFDRDHFHERLPEDIRQYLDRTLG